MKHVISFMAITLLSLASFATHDRSQITRGIRLLLENTETQADVEKLTDQALSLKARYDEILSQYQMNDLKLKKIDLGTTAFQFSSPIQVPGSKSNFVHGFIYSPMIPTGCETKFPATLFIHHVANDIDNEKLFASLAAKMKKGIVMLIFLPDYGPRKQDTDAPLISGDLIEFKEKLFQALLDIRVAGTLLSQQENVDPHQLQLGGLSLGGLVTAISAGVDPFFSKYLIAMGGGDIAGVMGMDKTKKTTGNIRSALAGINWDINESRKSLSALDAITWAYHVSGKEIIFINSKDDELIDNKMSVQKLVQAYKENGNEVIYKEHVGSHVPQVGDLGYSTTAKIYYRVLSNIVNFFGDSQSAELSQCEIR